MIQWFQTHIKNSNSGNKDKTQKRYCWQIVDLFNMITNMTTPGNPFICRRWALVWDGNQYLKKIKNREISRVHCM